MDLATYFPGVYFLRTNRLLSTCTMPLLSFLHRNTDDTTRTIIICTTAAYVSTVTCVAADVVRVTSVYVGQQRLHRLLEDLC